LQHISETITTYATSQSFYNIRIKHLQYPDGTSKILETYACNMRFQHNVTLLLGQMNAYHCRARRRRGGRRWRMELAVAAAAWSFCDSPMPAHGPGSRPWTVALLLLLQCRCLLGRSHTLTGDGAQCGRPWGAARSGGRARLEWG
jgi:hypothetical protein